MKYWDTSALLRAWKEGWVPAAGITRSHSISEWVAIQTGRGLVYQNPDGTLIKRNLSPRDAVREARRMFANLRFEDLTGDQTLAAMEMAARIDGLKGAAIHDYMHARTAELKKARSIVTLNLADFSRMTKLPLELPVKHVGGR